MPVIHPLVQKARDLMPLIASASQEHDEHRRLTRPVVEALIEGGFFTMLKTNAVGGMELRPSIFAQVTETLASADGSTGWVVCQSNGCSTTSAYLNANVAQEIFGRPGGILAWGPPGSSYEATPVEGGYRITGKWRFMSGQPERDVARRASAGGRHQGNEDVPLSQIERRIPRYLAHDRPARYGQQRILGRQFVHSARARNLS